MEILVYLQTENGSVKDFSYDLISYAREISKETAVISGAVVLKNGIFLNAQELRKYGLDKLYILRTNNEEYDKRTNPLLVLELIKKINPDIFILTSSTEGRELAPVIASTLGAGLTADCTKLEIQDNKLISTRPTFGGKLMASILSETNPQMATVRENTFKKKEFFYDENLKIEEFNFEITAPKTEILNFYPNKEEYSNLQNAKIVLAGGMGLKNKENFDKLKLLAKKINAGVGATRKAVDKGFIEKKFQIGQTGLSTTPEIYVAFGISGAIHHIVGMENSKKIIAINLDPTAPIFAHADNAIIADAQTVLDEWLYTLSE